LIFFEKKRLQFLVKIANRNFDSLIFALLDNI